MTVSFARILHKNTPNCGSRTFFGLWVALKLYWCPLKGERLPLSGASGRTASEKNREEDGRILQAIHAFTEDVWREESWKVLGSFLYLPACNRAHVHIHEFLFSYACDCVTNFLSWAWAAFAICVQGRHLRAHMLLIWREILRKCLFVVLGRDSLISQL